MLYACVSCVCSALCCVPTTTSYAHTQSFLFSVSRGSRRRERRRGRKGGGQGSSPASLPRPQFPAKVRCPARSPPLPWGGTGQPRASCPRGRGTWVPSSHLARGGPPGSPRGSPRCPPPLEPWGGRGVWSPVQFRPQHSCPRVSHRGAPTPPLPAGLGSPFPGPQRPAP